MFKTDFHCRRKNEFIEKSGSEYLEGYLTYGLFYGNPLFIFLGGYVPIRKQPAISGYQNIIFDGTIFTLYSTNIICYYTFVTFNGFLIFSHI